MAKMEELALAGGDVNPLKSDPDLQILLKKLDSIKKYKKFQGWKAKFLDRLEQFLYEEGMTPAQKACNDFEALLKKFVKIAAKVKDHIDKGQLSNTKKTVKAALALNEMCNSLTTVVAEVEKLIPYRKQEEKKRGFTKFHMGAVLIRQGFHQYITMKVIEDALTEIGDKAEEVADRQQHDLFAAYKNEVQRFCDVMSDLNLYEVMMKCLEFAEEPEDESEGPEEIEITIETHDGKTMKLELEVTETIARIKDAIAPGCGIEVEKQALSFHGKELDEDDKTLENLGIKSGATLHVAPMKIPITIRTMDGKEIQIQAFPTDTLEDVKKQLEEKTGLKVGNQKLSMNGIELGYDGQTVEFYGIRPNAVVDLEPKTMRVTVQMPDGSSPTIEITSADTSDHIKAKIAKETGMDPPRQILKYQGNELPSGPETVRDMGIENGATLAVEAVKVPITVNTMDGKKLEVMIDPFDTMGEIKKQLEGDSGLPANNQKLSMNRVEFSDDNNTAGFYGIKEGSELDLEPKSIKVSVKMPDGKDHTVEISPSDTSDSIKSKIEKQCGMAAPRQVLKFEGKELPTGLETAKDMGLQNGSEIQVEIFQVPVIVNTMDGKKLEIMVDPADKLSEIKKQLEPESGLSADNQSIFLKGQELADDSVTAADYGIKAGSELDLEPKELNVVVEMPDGKTHTIAVKPSDTSDAIKARIEKQTGMAAPRQVLKVEGKELPGGSATVKDMGVQDGSAIKVEVLKVPIVVNTIDGRQIKVMVDPSDKLGDIKKQLEDDSGVSADNQKLFLNGSELTDDNKKAADYGIQAGSELDLEPKSIKVTVEMPNGKAHTIEIKPSDTSDNIKAKIADETGMAAPTQVLKFNGKQLPGGSATVKDMGIQDGSKIQVDVFQVPVTVNTMDGKQIRVMVDPSDTLGAMKKRLEKESGLSADNQKLFLSGEELLDDDKVASDYGIKEGSELDLEPKSINVTVSMPDGTTHIVSVKPSDTSDAIKAAISAKSGMVPLRQLLKKDGKELPGGPATAKDMGIQDGSKIDVEIKTVPITVTTMNGEQIKAKIDPTETLGNIKKQLANKAGLPASNQKLFFGGKELADDGKSATAYGIKAGSELDLEPKTIKVTIDMPDGKAYEVSIKPSDTTDMIKAKIATETKMEAPRQVLSHDGKELPSGTPTTVREMGIREGSNISVGIYKLPITVNAKDGTVVKVMMEPSETVGAIKMAVQRKVGIESSRQCLKLAEKELVDDHAKLSECGIKAGSVLTVEPHLDPIVLVDIKCGTLFAMDRDDVIETGILTLNQGNKFDYLETAKDSAAKEKILKTMMDSPTLGVATQVVVEKLDVEDYELEEAEKVQSMWGVKLKKREKNKKGEELIFVDPKTGACGELSRKKCIELKVITPVKNGTRETLEEAEKETMIYDKYITDIRQVFGVRSAT